MGEKIRDIKEISIGKNKLMIEKNKGTHVSSDYDIHIQDENFRLNVTDHDFLKMAAAVMYADENLNSYKKKDLK